MSDKQARDPAELLPFLPTTVVRYQVPEKKPGYPWMELYAAMVAATTYLCSGIVQSYTSGAIYSIQTDAEAHISLSPSDISWIASAPPLSALLGTILAGPMMEKLGRKKTIALLSIPFIVGWLIIGFAVNFLMILIGRLVTGLSLGMSRACAPVYVSETSRPQHRGKLGFLPSIMSAVGVLLGSMLGTTYNWKDLAIFMSFLPAALLLASLYIPETPHWLISQNQEDMAFQSLDRLRRRRGNVDNDEIRLFKEIQEIRETIEQSSSITAAEYDHIHDDESILTLLQQPSIRRPAALVFLLMIFQQFSGVSAVIYYMKMILNHGEASLHSHGSHTYGPPPPPPLHTMDIRPTIVGVVHIAAFFITMPLVDRVGRRILLIVSGILMALSHLLLAFYLFTYSGTESNQSSLLGSTFPSDQPLGVMVRQVGHNDSSVINNLTLPLTTVRSPVIPTGPSDLFASAHSWLPLVSLCAYIASFSLASPVPYILMSEMFSLKVRAYLSSAAMLLCGISSFIVVLLFPHLMYGVNPVFTFLLFALFSLQNSLLGWIIPETKGKSLAEIENFFRGPKDFRGKVKATIEVPECAIIDVAAEIAEVSKNPMNWRY